MMETLLSVSYESTIEEAELAAYRLAEITGNISRQKWYGLAFAPVFLVISFFVFNNIGYQYSVGGAIGLIWIPVFLLTYKKHFRKQIRKMLVRARNTNQPVPSEFQLTEKGLSFKTQGQELSFEWKNVKAFNDNELELELVMEPAAIALIPKRVFSGPGEQQKWVDYIRNHTPV